MAGGFLEGVIRLYTEKGWQFKHLIFFVFAVIAMLPDTLKPFITKAKGYLGKYSRTVQDASHGAIV